MLIYKVLLPDQWKTLNETGAFDGAPIDLTDGYIHFSTAQQVRETVTKHFAGSGELMLAAVEADGLGDDLRWEVSRGGALFPHLYRRLSRDEVVSVETLLPVDGSHTFPADIP